MLRKLFAYALLLVTILWLALSYVPASVLPLPQIGFDLARTDPFFRWLLIGGLALFTLIQLWLVTASAAFFGRNDDGSDVSIARRFGLKPASEVIWTAIPIAMTLGLATVIFLR